MAFRRKNRDAPCSKSVVVLAIPTAAYPRVARQKQPIVAMQLSNNPRNSHPPAQDVDKMSKQSEGKRGVDLISGEQSSDDRLQRRVLRFRCSTPTKARH